MAGQSILVLAETHDEMLRPVSPRGSHAGSQLTQDLGLELVAGIFGSNVANAADELVATGVSKVMKVKVMHLPLSPPRPQ